MSEIFTKQRRPATLFTNIIAISARQQSFAFGDVTGFTKTHPGHIWTSLSPVLPIKDRLLAVMEEKIGHLEAAENANFKAEYAAAVYSIFPDIDGDFVASLLANHGNNAELVVADILDRSEPYPRAKKPENPKALKRKREELDEYDDEANEDLLRLRERFEDKHELLAIPLYLRSEIKSMLAQDFPTITSKDILIYMKKHDHRLLTTYLDLDRAMNDEARRPTPKHRRTQVVDKYTPERLPHTLAEAAGSDPAYRRVLEEFQTARQLRNTKKLKEDYIKMQEKEAEEQREAGVIESCGCCCEEFPLIRMVQCTGDVGHWFCISCAKSNASYQVGLGRYELNCMSMDGCSGGFDKASRDSFLDDKLRMVLDRFETDANLRAANIEGLASCPFCEYAEEYPPIEVNREFGCRGCGVLSCRLCNKKTHIPMSCEEAERDADKEIGIAARRKIEEAMSDAMIRKCNKCNTPFIREQGCNKMTCTKPNCRNVQCYVCSKSCDYAHFNDSARGGKDGNCPLWENAESRHEEEIRKAEAEVRKKILEENPNIGAEHLDIKIADAVKQDDARRAAGAGYNRAYPAPQRGYQRAARLPARGLNAVRAVDLANPVRAALRHFRGINQDPAQAQARPQEQGLEQGQGQGNANAAAGAGAGIAQGQGGDAYLDLFGGFREEVRAGLEAANANLEEQNRRGFWALFRHGINPFINDGPYPAMQLGQGQEQQNQIQNQHQNQMQDQNHNQPPLYQQRMNNNADAILYQHIPPVPEMGARPPQPLHGWFGDVPPVLNFGLPPFQYQLPPAADNLGFNLPHQQQQQQLLLLQQQQLLLQQRQQQQQQQQQQPDPASGGAAALRFAWNEQLAPLPGPIHQQPYIPGGAYAPLQRPQFGLMQRLGHHIPGLNWRNNNHLRHHNRNNNRHGHAYLPHQVQQNNFLPRQQQQQQVDPYVQEPLV